MASLLGGLGQSIIARLPQPPDPTTAESGFDDLIMGFAGGFAAAREAGKFKDDQGNPVTVLNDKGKPKKKGTFFGRLGKGFMGAGGEVAKAQDPLFAARETAAIQKNQLDALKIQQELDTRQQTIETESALTRFGRTVQGGINEGIMNNPDFKIEVGDFIARNPGMRRDPRFMQIVEDLKFAQQTENIAKAQEQAQANNMVQTRQTINTGTGTVTMEAPLMSNEDRLALARQHGLRVNDIGPRGEIGVGPVPQSTARRFIDPTTGKVVFEETIGGELTTSQAGNITQTISKLSSGINRVSEIIPNVESIFGPANMLGEVIVDRTLSNVFPEMAEGQRIEGRQLFRTFRESLFKGLSEGEGRLSDQDVERLRALFPKENTLIESPANAKIQLQTFRQELGREIAEKAKLTGAPIPEKALTSMSPKTLTLMLQNGEITEEQFKIGWDQNMNAEQKRAFIKQLQNAKR